MQYNALARRKGKAARQAVHFAEATFDALVYFFGRTGFVDRNQRQRFEVLDVALRVIIEDNARIEQPFRVEQLLDCLHGFKSCLSPFIFHEGGHVTSGAMFCFQRTVVFIDYQSLYVIHQVLVALYIGVGTEGLVQDKMVVAFQGMTVDAGIIVAVAGDELLQVGSGFGQVFDVEGYVLDEAGSAGLACTAYGWEYT